MKNKKFGKNSECEEVEGDESIESLKDFNSYDEDEYNDETYDDCDDDYDDDYDYDKEECQSTTIGDMSLAYFAGKYLIPFLY